LAEEITFRKILDISSYLWEILGDIPGITRIEPPEMGFIMVHQVILT
jgi:hypothetical protein